MSDLDGTELYRVNKALQRRQGQVSHRYNWSNLTFLLFISGHIKLQCTNRNICPKGMQMFSAYTIHADGYRKLPHLLFVGE
jgi:hypothetical protein